MKVWGLFVFHTASLLTLVLGQCKFPSHKLLPEKLTALNKLKPLMGKRFSVVDTSGYSYNVGICTDAEADGSAKDVGVLQKKLKDESFRVVVGKYTHSQIMAGPNWVLLEYGDGKPYGNHCNSGPRRAVIMFTCDESATDSKPGMLILEENTNKTKDCYYLFQLDHKEICDRTSSTVLSLGSIFLIIFFSVVAVYLVVGALYMRFALGAKGMEQIPNYSFWQDFGNLQADGCNFLCRSGDGNKGQRRYQGIGDDQLEERDDRDDNLLPM
ncbi:cation-dependent mannose-6-phosphate receptor-like [Gigantopelta aegis]|uniref:cation-dependent mannose-6-phosphate receptor-like n=1 Tax=Gigantopelta aegis TaxID=1735272 RepID=UPI001B88AB04|nr:cation-dependent mannose-6-phosphate receptor-like [Gigantopelta aegis]